jgi:hypothetical protein
VGIVERLQDNLRKQQERMTGQRRDPNANRIVSSGNSLSSEIYQQAELLWQKELVKPIYQRISYADIIELLIKQKSQTHSDGNAPSRTP